MYTLKEEAHPKKRQAIGWTAMDGEQKPGGQALINEMEVVQSKRCVESVGPYGILESVSHAEPLRT